METTQSNEPIYMAKLTQLIMFLKEESDERNEALEILKKGEPDEVKEMLRHLEARWPHKGMPSWEDEEIHHLETDWDLIMKPEEPAIFWTWMDAIRVRKLYEQGLPGE
jgi:hypothetical protein